MRNVKQVALASNPSSVSLFLLWILWFYVLLVTPFTLTTTETAPFLTSAYAYLAVGMAFGVVCALWMEARIPYRLSRQVARCLLAANLVIACFLVVPEWYLFCAGSLLGVDPYSFSWAGALSVGRIFSAFFSFIDDHTLLHQLVMVVNGASCSFLGSRLLFAAGGESASDYGTARDWGHRESVPLLVMVLVVLFLLGVMRPGFWAFYTRASGSILTESAWRPYAVDFIYYLPTLATFAILVVMLVLCAIAWYRWVDAARRVSSFLGIEVLAFVSGEVTWNLVSRCAQVSHVFEVVCGPMFFIVAALEVVLALLLLSMRVVGKRRIQKNAVARERGVQGSEEPLSPKTVMLDGLFDEWGLAPSERRVCKLMLEGKNSKESAELLGLKPSTVRNYLQRSYKKAGVTSAAELVELLEGKTNVSLPIREKQPVHGQVRSSEMLTTPSRPSNHVLEASLMSALIASVLLYCFPIQHHDFVKLWGVAHSFTLGTGLGCTLLGGMMLVVRPMTRSYLTRHLESHSGLLPASVAFFLSGGILLAVIWASCQHLPLAGTVFSIGLCIASSFFAASASVVALSLLTNSCRVVLHPVILLGFAIATVELVLVCLDARAWFILEGVDLVIFACAVTCLLAKKRHADPPEDGNAPDAVAEPPFYRDFELFLVSLMGFSAGLLSEELLRGADGVFFTGLQVFFYTGIAIICGVFIIREHKGNSLMMLGVAVAMMAIALLGHPLVALAYGGFCLFVLSVFLGRESTQRDGIVICVAVASIGLGLILGRGITDNYYSYLLWNNSARSFLGDEQFLLIAGPSFIAVVAVIGLISCALLLSIESVPANDQDAEGLEPERRRMLYLESQGLSEQESMTSLKIAKGYTGFQIAYESHYSFGSVNAWRASAYRKLGIHSKRDLIALLNEQVD